MAFLGSGKLLIASIQNSFKGLIGVCDNYFTNVQLYLNMNGSVGSTSITDSSSASRNISNTTGVQIASSPALFNESVRFDSGDYIQTSIDSNLQLSDNDFTIELAVHPDSISNNQDVINTRNDDIENNLVGVAY
ncbi:MAG: hypothetical protein R3230_00495 [Nitrosopumilaceae archaeon]|nr:hypothetical protein [Nitrosopumilaceae archaeon]